MAQPLALAPHSARLGRAQRSGLGAQRRARAQVERRIVEELRAQGLLAEPGRPRPRLPTYDDAEALPFLKAVINVRAPPAAPTLLRACGMPACAFAMSASMPRRRRRAPRLPRLPSRGPCHAASRTARVLHPSHRA